MTDLYVQNPDALLGQPKATIGNYVEQNGILVPRRFASLDEALGSGLPFIMRSEHVDEYAGAAGLLMSFKVGSELEYFREWKERGGFGGRIDAYADMEKKPQVEIEKAFIDSSPWARHYGALLGFNFEEFRQQINFSYWELLGGLNRSIVADSAIEGKYHVFTKAVGESQYRNYTILENGNIVVDYMDPLTEDLRAGIRNVMDFYERIRNLGNFDPSHCPIVEFQTINGANYFLQYHKTRDFRPASFRLDRDLEKSEVEALFVRGATSADGIVVKTVVQRSMNLTPFLTYEEGGFDEKAGWYGMPPHWEIMTRRRRVHFFDGKNTEDIAGDIIGQHMLKSKLFNPEISVSITEEDLISIQDKKNAREKARKISLSAPITVPLRVISDGRRAYVKKI